MPWKPAQQRAIAADLARRGKSRAEIAAFFRAHGYPKKASRPSDYIRKGKSNARRSFGPGGFP